MSAEFDALTAQIAQNELVEQSALTLINTIAAKVSQLAVDLANAGVDNTKALALAADLKTNADALSSAVAANTPAEG